MEFLCGYCREKTEHEVKPSNIKSMPEHKLLICSVCGDQQLVPPNALNAEHNEPEVNSVDVDSNRQIDDGCDSGVCPSR